MRRKLIRIAREAPLRIQSVARRKIEQAIPAEEARVSRLIDASGLSAIDASDLVSSLTKQRADRSTCHVIGSGASVLQTQSMIAPSDATYTCNYGGVIGLPIDLYVIEFADASERFRCQMEVIEFCRPDLVILKNFWEGKIDLAWAPDFPLARDILLPRGNQFYAFGHRRIIAEFLLQPPSKFLRQFKTTVLTMTFLAYFSGYSRIVIHGLDGGGPYLFHRIDTPLANRLSVLMPPSPDPHIAGRIANEFLRTLVPLLAAKGVSLAKAC